MSKFKLPLLLFLLLSCTMQAFASNRPVSLNLFSSFFNPDPLHLSGPISQDDKKLLKKITNLVVKPGCDPHVFDKPNVFHRLTTVRLCDKDNTTLYLKGLAKNYSNIRKLLIIQPDKTLDIDSIRYLRLLTKLQSLSIFCKVENSDELALSIPKKIVELNLANPNAIKGSFSKLYYLSLTDCSIEENFFEQFNAPNLGEIRLCSVSMSSETIKKLSLFKKLQYIYLDRKSFDTNKKEAVVKSTSARVLDYNCRNLSEYNSF